jgi:WD40 repeat protein/serine/threonine protein kinase
MDQCPSRDDLERLLAEQLPSEAESRLCEHIDTCGRCAKVLDELTSIPEVAAAPGWPNAGRTPNGYARAGGYERLRAWLPVTPPVPEDTPAESFPRIPGYEIERELGRGGMGVVYLARQTHLNRPVALKMILSGSLADPEQLVRFLSEGETIARLQHPNIVQIHEVGRCGGQPYFALEYVSGGTLAEASGRRPQPPAAAAELVECLARAVHFAHQHGIIHRDLKPANVLLQKHEPKPGAAGPQTFGLPKIADFGLAKSSQGQVTLTQSGVIMGTPGFMAPEQARGEAHRVGPPADIYALGAILFHLLTGRPPFQGETAVETLVQVVGDEAPAVRTFRADVPRDLGVICAKCLRKGPDQRYGSAEALAADLRRYSRGEPISARPVGDWERLWKWAKRRPDTAALIGALLFLVVLTAVGASVAAVHFHSLAGKNLNLAEEKETERAKAEQARLNVVRTLYHTRAFQVGTAAPGTNGLREAASFLDEWRGMALPEDPRGWEWAYLHTLTRQGHTTLRGHVVDALCVAWHPGGDVLASAGYDRSIFLWHPTTGRLLRSFPAPWGVGGMAWNPRGDRLASTSTLELRVRIWNPETGEPVRDLPRLPKLVRALAWHPRGDRIAAVSDDGSLVVWETETGRELWRKQFVATLRGVTWNPSGTEVAVVGETTTSAHPLAQIWNLESGQNKTLSGHSDSVRAVAWNSSGKTLATASLDGTTRVWDAETAALLQTFPDGTNEGNWGTGLAWNTDGTKLAVSSQDMNVAIWDVTRGVRARLLSGQNGTGMSGIAWSPSGNTIASASAGWNGEVRVWHWQKEPDVTALPVGAPSGRRWFVLGWSADDRHVVVSHDPQSFHVWDCVQRREVANSPGTACGSIVSPDGRRFVGAGRDGRVVLRDVSSLAEVAQLGSVEMGAMSVTWSANSGRVAVLDRQAEPRDDENLFATVWDLSGPRQLSRIKARGVALSPDGSRVAVGGGYKIEVHDAETGTELVSWRNPDGWNEFLKWSPDGQRLASISDYSVDVRSPKDGKPLYSLTGHTRQVTCLDWSPDGKRIATGSEDNTVRLWDAATGQPVLAITGPKGAVHGVAWSHTGIRLAALSSDGRLWVWDATHGYKVERNPELLPDLAARLEANPSDTATRIVRAGVSARLGNWEAAAEDAGCLPEPALLGWWSAEEYEAAGDPFSHADAPITRRPFWYCDADDPNGFVPLSKKPRWLMTRIYAPKAESVILSEGGPIVLDLWWNGRHLEDGSSRTHRVDLVLGWNLLVVQVADREKNLEYLQHPRAGLYLRLTKEASRP